LFFLLSFCEGMALLKKTLLMLSMVLILAGPMLYLFIVDKMAGGDSGVSVKMPEVPGLGLDWLISNSRQVTGTAEDMAEGSETKVYKWKDTAGIWQFASELPMGVADVETMLISSNTSVQTLRPTAVPDQVQDERPTGAKQDESLALDLIPTPVRVKKLIEDARNVQNILDDRVKQIDSLSAK